MKTVFGRDCTLTILSDKTFTAIPYSVETVRVVPKQYALPGVLSGRAQEVVQTYGQDICGCFITRLTEGCALCLFGLLTEYEKSFDIVIDRVLEKVVYRNVYVAGFELRAQTNGAVYLKIEVRGTKDSYAEPWGLHSEWIKWEREPTWHLREGNFSCTGQAVKLIYLYSFKGKFAETRAYRLHLHAPFLHDHLLSSAGRIERLDYALSKKTLMSFINLVPVDDLIDTNTGEELLVTRKYRVDGVTAITIQNDEGFWSGSI